MKTKKIETIAEHEHEDAQGFNDSLYSQVIPTSRPTDRPQLFPVRPAGLPHHSQGIPTDPFIRQDRLKRFAEKESRHGMTSGSRKKRELIDAMNLETGSARYPDPRPQATQQKRWAAEMNEQIEATQEKRRRENARKEEGAASGTTQLSTSSERIPVDSLTPATGVDSSIRPRAAQPIPTSSSSPRHIYISEKEAEKLHTAIATGGLMQQWREDATEQSLMTAEYDSADEHTGT